MSPADTIALSRQRTRLEALIARAYEHRIVVHASTMEPKPRHLGECSDVCGELEIVDVVWGWER